MLLFQTCGAAARSVRCQGCNRAIISSRQTSAAAPYTCCVGLRVISTCSSSSSSSNSNSSSSNSWPSTASRKSHRLAAKASAAGGSVDDDDDSEESIPQQGKPLRVERLLANLGYGKRKECTTMIKRKQLVYAATGQPAKVGEKALPHQLLLDGERLDPAPPLTLVLHKPVGYVVTSPEDEVVLDPKIYDLLPFRFGRRKPFLSAVGRLDKDTSGLLLMTDDGQLLHSIQSPTKGIWKCYRAKLDSSLTGRDAEKAVQRFGSGQMQLQGDRTPLLPAALHMLDDTTAEVSICEGRYHQIRRMFASLGHTVVQLHRHTIGGLSLLQEPDLALGSWRLATAADIQAVLSGPESLEAAVQQQGPRHAAAVAPSDQAGQAQHPATGSSSGSNSSVQLPHSREDVAEGSHSSSSPASSSDVDTDDELYEGDDVDHVGEAAAAARRFKTSSKRTRRKAVLARQVQAMRLQQQQQQQQNQREAGD